MGKTKKAQVMFTCTHEVKDFLTKWAARENRTVSNLVETLVVDAITTQGEITTGTTDDKGKGGKGGKE